VLFAPKVCFEGSEKYYLIKTGITPADPGTSSFIIIKHNGISESSKSFPEHLGWLFRALSTPMDIGFLWLLLLLCLQCRQSA
jgi:hypothetical protein